MLWMNKDCGNHRHGLKQGSCMKYSKSTPPALPDWMKVRLPFAVGENDSGQRVRDAVNTSRLLTVCEEAACPNLGHCWSRGTATFLIMGDRCTRRCGFCNIKTAKPFELDPAEPERTARAVLEMRLSHAVITSVDRDDLSDGGSMHFARVIARVKEINPKTTVEVLIPDFKGKEQDLQNIWKARPDIINHNVETVPSLYRDICPQSSYEVSLKTLRLSSRRSFLTKSGIILGMGESIDEVKEVIHDLRQCGVQLLTIGQYLQPTEQHYPLKDYVSQDVFENLADFARASGFLYVESGPLVRSSYHAGEALQRLLKAKNEPDQGRIS